jgi:hypothetical protein
MFSISSWLRTRVDFKSTADGSGHHRAHHIVDQLVPGTAAADIGKAEDAAHASGDTGVMMLAVRRDAAAVGSGTDGDYSTLNVDSYGRLRVDASGGVAEDAALAGGEAGSVALAQRQDTRGVSAGTTGDAAFLGLNAQGDLYVNVSKTRATLSHTMVVSTSPAYTAGDSVGGKLTFANAARFAAGSFDIGGIVLTDAIAQSAEMDLVLFDSDPSASTLTDNAAVVVAAADLSKICAIVNLNDYKVLGASGKSATYFFGISQPIKLASGTSLYGVLITRSTPTYSGTDNLTLEMTVTQD